MILIVSWALRVLHCTEVSSLVGSSCGEEGTMGKLGLAVPGLLQ